MDFKNLPKVELHLHLDCSLSFEVVKKIQPSISFNEYQNFFIAPPKCIDLADYLERAKRGFGLMQTEEQLRLVTDDLFKQLEEDKVIYAEIRFAPLLHTTGGLSAERVVAIVNDAVDECIKQYGIDAGIILCTVRRSNEAESLTAVKLVKEFHGTHVVGFDIAGDEAGFPIDVHLSAFQYANRNNIKCTAHAGEAKGSESVWETLKNFQPLRIGHGVRSAEDKELISYLIAHNIHLEVCPTSNIQVNVFDKIEDHTVNELYNAGVSLSINTDTRTISNVTLTKEYQLMHRVFNWNPSHFKNCNLAAIQHSFAKEGIKERLKFQIEKAY